MRFLLLLVPRAGSEAGVLPDAGLVGAIGKYREELAKAGVLLALDGLHPGAQGVRVDFEGGRPRVVDGPFPGGGEEIGGCGMIAVKSREEAIEWARRYPDPDVRYVEIRQVLEGNDRPADLPSAAGDSTTRIAPRAPRGA